MSNKAQCRLIMLIASIILFSIIETSKLAQAGIIIESGPGGGPIFTPDPNNDDFQGMPSNNPNNFGISFNPQVFGSFDNLFTVQNSGGTTEYEISISFFNFTDRIWSGFKVELGFISGTFIGSNPNDDLDFDFPVPISPSLTSHFFTNVQGLPGGDFIKFSNGEVPRHTPGLPSPGGVTFSIDFPDYNSNIPLFAQIQLPDGSVAYNTYLRLTPIPMSISSTLSLIIIGLVGFGFKYNSRNLAISRKNIPSLVL